MLVFPVYFLKSFAYAGVGVTIFSALSALLVLPALLAVLGHRVNAGRIRGIRADAQRRGAVLGAAGRRRDAPPGRRRRCRSSRCCCSSPRRCSVTFGTPDERVLPTSAASHQVGDALRNDFATTPDVIDVLITPALPQPELAELHATAQPLPACSGRQHGRSFAVSVAATGTAGSAPATQRISLSTGLDAASGAAQDLVRQGTRATARRPGATCSSAAPPRCSSTPSTRSARTCCWPAC